jgi:hypothetical protein
MSIGPVSRRFHDLGGSFLIMYNALVPQCSYVLFN